MQKHFLNKIISWYLEHKRDLPWRHTQDPYLIWLSEIILQQTRVNQGMPYYFAFSEKYPNITAFANAPSDEIMRTWQGLGYYSRARNMHATAQMIRDKYAGVFPVTYTELLKLKGIGGYTAAAISSFVVNEKRAVLDGNVYRVLSRYWGIEEPINSSKGPKLFSELANDIIVHTEHNGLYNQAIMEFGALHCKPVAPDCKNCPVAPSCVALEKNMTSTLPIKLNKLKVKERAINYIIWQKEGRIYMKKRGDGDIWNGLYDFPELNKEELPPSLIMTSKVYTHKLTHQKLSICFFVSKADPDLSDTAFFSYEECEQLPKPIIVKQFLEEHKHLFNHIT